MELLQRADILLEEATFSDDDSNEGPCFDFAEELTRISRQIDEQSSDFFSIKEVVGIKRTESLTNLSVRIVPNKDEPTLKRIANLNEKLLPTETANHEVIIHLNSDTDDESDGEILFLQCVNSELTKKYKKFPDNVKCEYKTGEFKTEVQHSIHKFDFSLRRHGLVTEQVNRFKAYEEFVTDIEKKVRESHTSREKPFKMFVREFKKAIFSFSYPLKPGFSCHDDNFFRIDNLVWQLPCQNEVVPKKAYSRFVKAKFNQKKIMESFANPLGSLPVQKEQLISKSTDHVPVPLSSLLASSSNLPAVEDRSPSTVAELPVLPENALVSTVSSSEQSEPMQVDAPPAHLVFDPFPNATSTPRPVPTAPIVEKVLIRPSSNDVDIIPIPSSRDRLPSKTSFSPVLPSSAGIRKLTPDSTRTAIQPATAVDSPSTSGAYPGSSIARKDLFPMRYSSLTKQTFPLPRKSNSYNSNQTNESFGSLPNDSVLFARRNARYGSAPVGQPFARDRLKPSSPPASTTKLTFFNQKVIPLAGPASSLQLVNNSLFSSSMKVIESEKTTSSIDEPRNVPLIDTSVLLQKSTSPLRVEKKKNIRDTLVSPNSSLRSPLRIASTDTSRSSNLFIDAPELSDSRSDPTPEVLSCVSEIVKEVENNTSVILGELVEITCNETERVQLRRPSENSDLTYHTVDEQEVELEVITLQEPQGKAVGAFTAQGDSVVAIEHNAPSIPPPTPNNLSIVEGIATPPVVEKIQLSSISKGNRKRKADQGLYVIEDQSSIASREKEPDFATLSNERVSFPIVILGDEDEDDFTHVSFLDKSRHRLALNFSNPFATDSDQEAEAVPVITLEDFTSKPPNTTFLLQHLEEEFPVGKVGEPVWRLIPVDTFPGEGLRIFEKYKLPNHIELPLRNTECFALLDADHQPVSIPLISLAPKQSQAVCPVVTIDDEEDEEEDEEEPEIAPHPGMVELLNSLGSPEYIQRRLLYKKMHYMLTAEEQRKVSNYSYYLSDELLLMEKGLVPFFGTTVVKRYKYPFDHCKGLYWPLFQPTDGVSIEDYPKLMVADVYNQITNQSCYSYAQKKDLLCDASPNRWNTQFREVMDKSDSYLADKGRFKYRVSYARTFAQSTEMEAKTQDLVSQLEEAFWIRRQLRGSNITAVSDHEERMIVQADVQCNSNVMHDHVRFNITDKYSSRMIDRNLGERNKSIFPDSWQQYPRDVYLCTNSRRNLIPDAVNHLNSVVYREIDNTDSNPPAEEHILETQKAILHAAYLFQRGRIGNQSSPLLSEEENQISKKRTGKMKALLFTITYNGKSSTLNDLWEMLALQDWEIKYWPIIWDNLAATYKKLPPVSLLSEKYLDELHQSYTRYVNMNDRREYCKTYYSKLDLRKPLTDAQ